MGDAANRKTESVFAHIDQPIAEIEFKLQLGMSANEIGQNRRGAATAEQRGVRDAQSPGNFSPA
jgi:hypothetical protein